MGQSEFAVIFKRLFVARVKLSLLIIEDIQIRVINYFRTLWRPEVYHGQGRRRNYFEGWFFKVVDATRTRVLAFIPGIFLGKDLADSHAFVQVLDNMATRSHYFRFPLAAFRASRNTLDVQIADNSWQTSVMKINLENETLKIRGQLAFSALQPWPITLTSPGVMGWYAFVPFMQCFHGVISFDHRVEGSLLINKETLQFDGGRGYIEKDWGTSFPSAYIWLQSNHFEQPGVSLMLSIARIPWLRGDFRGFIIGLYLAGHLYRFTTYTGAKLEHVRLTPGEVQVQVVDRSYRLTIVATRNNGSLLHAPYEQQMMLRVAETLSSEVKVSLFRLQDEALIFAGRGLPAALDVHGKMAEIVDEWAD
ncbi:MAG: tocopherol cyclase family protein [candidate division KSB1 bacterium]|nr:tocopherol cyclase family protein [candidate division KSB1 bacterium]MDZ7318689.1 tocopherol cyclase family protein [candidate division KSB1 bacterium]MDZ7342191.1 tocopherol cyclase family protein [candidate division KSB1 bacterium]